MKTFLTFILLSTSFLSWSQPSFSVSIQFQLKDEQGILNFQRLCSEYQIRESSRATDLRPCDLTKKYRSGYYIDSIQSIRISATIVYNDVNFDIIRDSDTMHICCPTWVATQRNFHLGIVPFEAGYYQVYQNEIDTFNLARGRYDYYNQLVAQVKADQEYYSSYQSQFTYRQLMKLQALYGFPIGSLEEKEVVEFK
ncbi:hypothetical protein [Croceimicrobium sp.]|uniref:hypothetical protein n=1 Tax=Croceimicrobium sp. TaxID=2828340 RepID=UPI003BA96DE1